MTVLIIVNNSKLGRVRFFLYKLVDSVSVFIFLDSFTRAVINVSNFSFFDLLVIMVEHTASDVFCSRMLSMVNSEDVNAIIQAQRHMWVSDWAPSDFLLLHTRRYKMFWFVLVCERLRLMVSWLTVVTTGSTALRKPMKCWSTLMGCLMCACSRWTSVSCSTLALLWRWRKIWTASLEGSG